MCIFARLGGEWGPKLSRAAFGILLKFSDNLEQFMKLAEEINAVETELGQEVQGAQKINDITRKLKEVESDSFTNMLK